MEYFSLFNEALTELLKLESVRHTEKSSFRIGSKVFIRYQHKNGTTTFGFKLLKEDAIKACKMYKCCEPMEFGGMGTKGWVDVTLSGKQQLPVLLRLAGKSRALY